MTSDLFKQLVDALRSYRLTYFSERALQESVAQVLDTEGILYKKEAVLSARERIDFLVNERIGIECKISGSDAHLARQLMRYIELGQVKELIVVTSRRRHVTLPGELLGVPLEVIVVAAL